MNDSHSIMAPALKIIKALIVLGIIGASVSGFITLLAIVYAANEVPGAQQGFVFYGVIFVQCVITVLSLFILRCFVLCMDSIEKTVRRIEKNTRKDKKTAEREE